MSEHVDVLKRGYDAFNSGDAETLAGVFADDIRGREARTSAFPEPAPQRTR